MKLSKFIVTHAAMAMTGLIFSPSPSGRDQNSSLLDLYLKFAEPGSNNLVLSEICEWSADTGVQVHIYPSLFDVLDGFGP